MSHHRGIIASVAGIRCTRDAAGVETGVWLRCLRTSRTLTRSRIRGRSPSESPHSSFAFCPCSPHRLSQAAYVLGNAFCFCQRITDLTCLQPTTSINALENLRYLSRHQRPVRVPEPHSRHAFVKYVSDIWFDRRDLSKREYADPMHVAIRMAFALSPHSPFGSL